jgi:hypothetical protein
MTGTPDDRAWETVLPMRFNAPPGWSRPSLEWTFRHCGLEMSEDWIPEGAGPLPPDGWEWWIKQEPAWSEWMTAETRGYRMAFWILGAVLAACTVVALTVLNPDIIAWAILVGVCALFGLVITLVHWRSFRVDPLGKFRDDYNGDGFPTVDWW